MDFEELYHRHFRDVYSFAYALSRNETIAEEITQETFFKALRSIDSFKGHCKMTVWLCQIAKNTYFTYESGQKRFARHRVPERAGAEDVEDAVLNKDDAFRIHQALHRLHEPYKEVFTLRVFGELSFAQIAQLFEKSESWARVTFYRAKQHIRNALKEESPQ
ncbi:RNA polymerase sigma factor [Paenibacillus flagellatus]|uniref:RNA polymerase subunit sigma n=1 Tax=Paenibacillus flagellatus TaxID=2211139 RepID=A0A2V5K0E6_9BACL|nr:RNA polymerase sigma factor [Paenibacillus flagellatus]PYI52571.1 RNA polymerase subunit sigma [Paenibacillus flagellatus]